MPATLQVREVHDALYLAGGGSASAGNGAPSTVLLGRLFHEVFADLIGSDPQKNLKTALVEGDLEGDAQRRSVLQHVYDRLVGPRLRCHQANLHCSSPQVLTFWQAITALCDWLMETPGKAANIAPADPLSLELRDPGWTDSVLLTGIPDALVRLPNANPWCVVELKLGRTSPEADLGQTCLYHMMLSQRGPEGHGKGKGPGALALVSFEPGPRERVFESRELEDARRSLINLIGRLAGVVPTEPGPPPKPVKFPPKPDPRYKELGEKIVSTLAEYGATVRLAGPPIVGPTFLRYPVSLGTGVKIAAIQSRANELRVRLGLDASPRIGIEGSRVVIDVQRPDRQTVTFSQIREQLPDLDQSIGNSKVPLGVDMDGQLRFADLSQPEHSHILIAGTTGSGKSEWLRTLLAGLMATNTPETLRLVLIDPKRNAFTALRNSPFLYRPIVYPDERPVSAVLEELAEEMDSRYRAMGKSGSDSLAELLSRSKSSIPRIVCVCDEYADLLRRDRDERKALENQVFRLGSKARAAGIHLAIATQQPSREVIKGALDANIPARVGLKMERTIESRMLLGIPGAETLLGYGDLLFKDIGDPVRLQGAYLPSEERDRVFAHSLPQVSVAEQGPIRIHK